MATSLKLALVNHNENMYIVARRAEIGEVRLSRISSGRSKPTPEEKAKLSEILGVPENELFSNMEAG